MPGVLISSSKVQPSDILPGRTPRILCAASWPGVEFFVKDQDISSPITWSIAENRHSVVVHLDGPIHRLETELEGAGALLNPPMNGEAWVIPAGEHYASFAHGKVVRFAELFLDPQAFKALTGRSLDLPPIRPVAGHYDEFLYRAVERLEHLAQQPGDMAAMVSESLSKTVYLHVLQEYAGSRIPSRRPRRQRRFHLQEKRLLTDYIDENLDRRIVSSQLASLVAMKVHQFLEAFRESFGTTPAQYIIEQRLRRARWLLTTTRSDITTIAFSTGFSNHGHLTSVFRSRLGVTPKEFRAAQS